MIDLKNWALTDNRDKTGGKTGEAVTLDPGKFTIPMDTDGGLIFRAEVDDATTSGSKYPRKELREWINGQKAAWKLSEGCEMSGMLQVNELPIQADGTPGKVVIAQHHGKEEELFRLYYDAGRVYWKNDLSKASPSDSKPSEHEFDFQDLPKIPMRQPFSYTSTIDPKAMKHTMTVRVDGVTHVRTIDIDPVWLNDELYAKAGCYLGNNVKQGAKGAGEVKYFALDVSRGTSSGASQPPAPPGPPAPNPPTMWQKIARLLRVLADEMEKL